MTEPSGSSLEDRMDEDYQPPILVEPEGGPIPQGQDPDGDDSDDEPE